MAACADGTELWRISPPLPMCDMACKTWNRAWKGTPPPDCLILSEKVNKHLEKRTTTEPKVNNIFVCLSFLYMLYGYM